MGYELRYLKILTVTNQTSGSAFTLARGLWNLLSFKVAPDTPSRNHTQLRTCDLHVYRSSLLHWMLCSSQGAFQARVAALFLRRGRWWEILRRLRLSRLFFDPIDVVCEAFEAINIIQILPVEVIGALVLLWLIAA